MLTFCVQRSLSDGMDIRTVSGGKTVVLVRNCWRCRCMKLSVAFVCLKYFEVIHLPVHLGKKIV